MRKFLLIALFLLIPLLTLGAQISRDDILITGDADLWDDTPHISMRDTDDNTAYCWHLDTSVAADPFQGYTLWRGTDTGTGFNVSPNTPLMFFDASNDLFLSTGSDLTTTGLVTGGDFKDTTQSLGSPTYSTYNDFFNSTMSVGRKSGGTITDAGSETVNVAAGTGFIKATDDDNAQVLFFNWSASSGLSVPTDTVRYIGVEYNAGSPQVVASATQDWDLDTEFPLGSVINQAGDLYVINDPWWVTDGITNIIERFQSEGTIRDNYVGGLILGTSTANTTRKPTLTAGTVWSRLTEFDITAKDCSAGSTFYGFYRDGGTGWTRTAAKTDIDDFYDNNSGTLQALDLNKYVNFWVFLEVDTVNSGQLMVIYPQTQYNTAAAAEAGAIPAFPTIWYKHGILVGRIIVKQGVTAPAIVQTSFGNGFSYALASDHGNLSGLADDDHTQYLLANGTRTGASSQAQTLTNGALLGSATTDGIYQLIGDGKARFGDDYSTGYNAILNVGDDTTSTQSHLGFFCNNQSTSRSEITLANSGDADWGQNFLAFMVHGGSVSNNYYATDIAGKTSDAGYGFILGQGNYLTALGIGTYSAVPMYFFTGNSICITALSDGTVKLSKLTSDGFVKTGSGDGTLSVDTEVYAADDQTFYIGTTQVAINRASAALTLAGITLTTPDIGTPSAGTLTNCTGLPAASVVAGTLGTGAYVFDSTISGMTGIVLADNGTIGSASDTDVMTIDSSGNTTFTVFPITPSAAPDADYEVANKKYVDDNAGGAPEGTAVLSTGEGGGTKFLREDGDGTCSWQSAATGGETLAQTLAIGADANDVSITSMKKLEGLDSDIFIDLGNDGHIDFNADTSLDFQIGTTEQIVLTDGKLSPTTDSDIDLGDGTHYFKNAYIDSITTTGNGVIGGDFEVNGHATFDAEVANTVAASACTVDWGAGNKQKLTLDDDCAVTFTAPDGVGNFLLHIIQDAGGANALTFVTSIKWVGGAAPTFTTTGDAEDIITFYYDGTSYYGAASLAFATP